MFGIQAVQQLVAQDGQVMFLLQAVLFLMMGEGCLADQQDDQQNDATDKQCDDNIQNDRLLCAFVLRIYD